MTKKIFWQNPYLTELATYVTSVNADRITVAETIFYAFSGGQESDYGSIGDYPVLEAKKEGKEIFYTISSQHTLKAGDLVIIKINWERRYQLMRLHFAAEIILELLYKTFPGIIKIGAHIAQDKARIDIQLNESIKPFLPLLEQEAQNIINSNQAIISTFSDEENERRYWKINHFLPVACGGTHVKNTSEIGTIHLKRVNPGQGKERIEIYLF